jgi:hypothetical protein
MQVAALVPIRVSGLLECEFGPFLLNRMGFAYSYAWVTVSLSSAAVLWRSELVQVPATDMGRVMADVVFV